MAPMWIQVVLRRNFYVGPGMGGGREHFAVGIHLPVKRLSPTF
jgi:hypothetical protein